MLPGPKTTEAIINPGPSDLKTSLIFSNMSILIKSKLEKFNHFRIEVLCSKTNKKSITKDTKNRYEIFPPYNEMLRKVKIDIFLVNNKSFGFGHINDSDKHGVGITRSALIYIYRLS
jgi:hypothetical protein